MRLICPNCATQYEVDASAVPMEGRDVQCGNCATTWFQSRQEEPQPAPPVTQDWGDTGETTAAPELPGDTPQIDTAPNEEIISEPEIDEVIGAVPEVETPVARSQTPTEADVSAELEAAIRSQTSHTSAADFATIAAAERTASLGDSAPDPTHDHAADEAASREAEEARLAAEQAEREAEEARLAAEEIARQEREAEEARLAAEKEQAEQEARAAQEAQLAAENAQTEEQQAAQTAAREADAAQLAAERQAQNEAQRQAAVEAARNDAALRAAEAKAGVEIEAVRAEREAQRIEDAQIAADATAADQTRFANLDTAMAEAVSNATDVEIVEDVAASDIASSVKQAVSEAADVTDVDTAATQAESPTESDAASVAEDDPYSDANWQSDQTADDATKPDPATPEADFASEVEQAIASLEPGTSIPDDLSGERLVDYEDIPDRAAEAQADIDRLFDDEDPASLDDEENSNAVREALNSALGTEKTPTPGDYDTERTQFASDGFDAELDDPVQPEITQPDTNQAETLAAKLKARVAEAAKAQEAESSSNAAATVATTGAVLGASAAGIAAASAQRVTEFPKRETEELTSSLRPKNPTRSTPKARLKPTATPEPIKSRFGTGFFLALFLFALALLAYIFRAKIAEMYPAAGPALESYAMIVDKIRLVLQDTVRSILAFVTGFF